MIAACWAVAEKQHLSNAAWVAKVMKPCAKKDLKVQREGEGSGGA